MERYIEKISNDLVGRLKTILTENEVLLVFIYNKLNQIAFRQFTMLIIILAISLCYASFYLVDRLFEQELAVKIEELHVDKPTITRVVEENVRRMLSQADTILLLMKFDMEEYGYIKDKHLVLLRSFLKLDIINQIAIADKTGNLIFSAVPLNGPINISTREHLQAQVEKDSGELYIAASWINRVTGTPSIFLSRRINDDNGNFSGIVAVGLDPNYLSNVFSQLELGADNSIVLLRTDGNFLARVPGNIAFEKMTARYPSHLVFDNIRQGIMAGTYESVAKSDDIVRYGAFRAFPDYPLVVLSGISKESALQETMKQHTVYRYRAAVFSIIVLTSLLIIWLQMRRQVKTAAELHVSQGRYKALLNQSSEAIAVADFDTGCILEVNEAYVSMFGYSKEENLSMKVFDLWIEAEGIGKEVYKSNLKRDGVLPSQIMCFRNKQGHNVYTQRSVSFIHYREQSLIMVTYNDITSQQKMQSKIQSEVVMAGKVQRMMLPPDYQDEKLTIKTIYKPVHIVSGDSYGYQWSRDSSKLYGYVIDVTGHGMATALHTSAISNLLNELLDAEQDLTTEMLTRLNERLLLYFQDDSFLAIIVFTIDFQHKVLSCVSGGINHILMDTGNQPQMVAIPGSYLGICHEAEFESITVPIRQGDSFYFISDGLYDIISQEMIAGAKNFEDTLHVLNQLAIRKGNRDDCSAICICIEST